MLKVNAEVFYRSSLALDRMRISLQTAGDPNRPFFGPKAQANPTSVDQMQRDLADQREAFAALGVRMALKSLERLIDVLKNPKCTCSEVAREMAEIESRIRDELGAVSLFAIPDARASYFNQGELFGHEVFKAFPSADNDILEVGNCLALERGTAAVMHLMRVVEVGLRALRMRRAEALRITGLHTFAR